MCSSDLDSLRSPDRRETQVERAVFERIVVVGERSAQVSRKRITRERVVACTLHRNAASMTVSLRCRRELRTNGLPMSSRWEERKRPDEQERNDSHFRNHPLCLARSVGDVSQLYRLFRVGQGAELRVLSNFLNRQRIHALLLRWSQPNGCTRFDRRGNARLTWSMECPSAVETEGSRRSRRRAHAALDFSMALVPKRLRLRRMLSVQYLNCPQRRLSRTLERQVLTSGVRLPLSR